MALPKGITNAVPVSGDAEITGAKTFTQGPYAAMKTLTGSEITLNPAQGSLFYVNLALEKSTRFLFAVPPEGKGAIITLVLYSSTGAENITWQNIFWAGQQFPSIGAGFNVLTFLKFQDGMDWIGAVSISSAHHVDLS